MQFLISLVNGERIAEIHSSTLLFDDIQDALDIVGNCAYYETRKLILKEENIHPSFFELKTRKAGEVLQKFITYGLSASIVGDFDKYQSKSLRDFIFESNKAGRINFVTSTEAAKRALAS